MCQVCGGASSVPPYSGALPAALLSSLPFLASLCLADNQFHGELPVGVPLPPSLRILDLSGAIPGSLFTASSATASPHGVPP